MLFLLIFSLIAYFVHFMVMFLLFCCEFDPAVDVVEQGSGSSIIAVVPAVSWCAGELAYSASCFGDMIHQATPRRNS